MITWYAAYTQPRREMKALENLGRQGYETYLPQYRGWVRHARKRSAVLKPLFPRYLFVGIDRLTQRWRPISSTIGMVGLVKGGEEPVPVPRELVADLRKRELDGAVDLAASTRLFRIGDSVRVTEGPFDELVGRLIGMADSERVYVLLDFLGRSVRANLSLAAIDAA
jgi:transcriptional antiterminator RfaH